MKEHWQFAAAEDGHSTAWIISLPLAHSDEYCARPRIENVQINLLDLPEIRSGGPGGHLIKCLDTRHPWGRTVYHSILIAQSILNSLTGYGNIHN